MKKSVKVIIAGAIVAAIGLMMVLCALGISGGSLKGIRNWQTQSVEFDTPINKLQMEANAGQVTIRRGATDKIKITYDYDDSYAPEIGLKNGGVLNIETGRKHWYDLGLWFNNAPSMQVEVPENWTFALDVTLNAGSLTIGDGDWGEVMDVELNAGAVSIGNVTVTKLNIEVNAGGLTAKEVVCSEFDCEVNAGGVNVKKLDATTITVDVSAGSANLGLVGAKSDYNIRVDKSAGSCNVISQSNPSASRSLRVDVSAGSADVTFGK